MRFHEGGPSLPHHLLEAADDGRVVFFCGAGVSRARAGLPDFGGLVDAVVKDLRPLPGGMVARLLAAEDALRRAEPQIELPPGVAGLAPADRLFGFLEEEFSIATVESAVARTLRTPDGVDLSAHETLVRLATAGGRTRLVTTNFDLLFEEAAGGTLNVLRPPDLPRDFDGLVKLHGTIKGDFSGAEDEGFVLSTATFGGAYVADGWAARFMRRTLEHNTVVFVGYAADDPPMQYLLEALARTEDAQIDAYALQSDGLGIDRWHARGVRAIPYDARNGHGALWSTLEAWSHRVADPGAWRASMAAMARTGPRTLSPVRRGQVAELVTSTRGAKTFAGSADEAPPAEWLCVFDPYCRFAKPGPEAPATYSPLDGDGLDPFEFYGLDDDPPPRTDLDRAGGSQRGVPSEAWDGLRWTERDQAEIRAGRVAKHGAGPLRGMSARTAELPPRLGIIANWFVRVMRQPAALWWARRQGRLHPAITQAMTWDLARPAVGPCDAAQAWALLMETWEAEGQATESEGLAAARFRHETAAFRWSGTTRRRCEELTRPRLRLRSDDGAAPPVAEAGVGRLRLVVPRIELAPELWRAEVPDEALGRVVTALRRNLERLVEHLDEHPFGMLRQLPPVVRSADSAVSSHQYKRDLGGAVFGYLAKLDRLRVLDRAAFDAQVVLWPSEPRIFGRLRIWHALDPARSSSDQAFASIDALSDEAFWMIDHQRDLLHTLRDRWPEFTPQRRQRLERRLLEGAIRPRPTEPDEQFRARRAHTVLDAVHWLRGQGVEFSFDWQNEEVTRLRADAPRWTDARPSSAVEPMVSRGGAVRTDADHAALDDLPVEEVVARAAEIAGPTNDFLVEADPFLGLVRDDPDRALAAIECATASRDKVVRALSTLLWEDVGSRRPDLTIPIAELLARVGDAVFKGTIGAVARWLDKVTATEDDPIGATHRDALVDRGIALLPDAERDLIETPPRRTDWVFQAINAPAGNLAEALMRDGALPSSADGVGLPAGWRGRAERLLDLPEPHRDLALVILVRNLPYLFAQDRGWACRRLIPAFTDDRRAAALAGLLQVHTGCPPISSPR